MSVLVFCCSMWRVVAVCARVRPIEKSLLATDAVPPLLSFSTDAVPPLLSVSTEAVPPLLSFSTDAMLRYRLTLKVSGISMNFGAGKLYSLALLAMLFRPLPHVSIKPLCGMDDLLRQPLAKLDDGPRVGFAKNVQHHLQLTGIATRYFFQQIENLRVTGAVSK